MRSHLNKEQLKKDENYHFQWNYADCLLYANGKEVSYGEFLEQLGANASEEVIYNFLIKQVEQFNSHCIQANLFTKHTIEGKYLIS